MPLPSTSVRWVDASTYVSPVSGQVNVNDAIAALGGSGGCVYFPPGTYNLDTMHPTIVLPRGVTLMGDGREVSIIRQNVDATIVKIVGDYAQLKDLTLMGTTGTVGFGVVIGGIGMGVIRGTTLERCVVRSTGSSVLEVPGSSSDFVLGASVVDCEFRINRSGFALIRIGANNIGMRFQGCSFDQFYSQAHCVQASGDAHSFRDCTFEGVMGTDAQWLALDGALNCLVDHCWFEDDGSAQTRWFIALYGNSQGVKIDSCTFRRRLGNDPRAISGLVGPCSSVVINAHMLTAGGNPVSTDHIYIPNVATNEMLVLGGCAQGPSPGTIYPLIVRDDSERSMTVGGNARLRVQRLSSDKINDVQLMYSGPGQLVFDKTSGKLRLRNNAGWVNVSTS